MVDREQIKKIILGGGTWALREKGNRTKGFPIVASPDALRIMTWEFRPNGILREIIRGPHERGVLYFPFFFDQGYLYIDRSLYSGGVLHTYNVVRYDLLEPGPNLLYLRREKDDRTIAARLLPHPADLLPVPKAHRLMADRKS